LTVREEAEEVSITKTVCHDILTENLGTHRIAAKFVPRLLTDDQKKNRGGGKSFWTELFEKKTLLQEMRHGCTGTTSNRKFNNHSGCQKRPREEKSTSAFTH
jgi:hypothetical protein